MQMHMIATYHNTKTITLWDDDMILSPSAYIESGESFVLSLGAPMRHMPSLANSASMCRLRRLVTS